MIHDFHFRIHFEKFNSEVKKMLLEEHDLQLV